MFKLNQRVIQVERDRLLTVLQTNRNAHAEELKEAEKAFMERLEADLKAALKLLKKADFKTAAGLSVHPRAPVSHLKEFDEVIEMLQYSVSDVIEIDSTTFNAYVRNVWAWSEDFKRTVDQYKVAGSSLRLN